MVKSRIVLISKFVKAREVNANVPFRNLVFISHALSLAETSGIQDIFVAFNKDDSTNFWDCRPGFVQALNTVSKQGSRIVMHAPSRWRRAASYAAPADPE